jgi:hypothetical protein
MQIITIIAFCIAPLLLCAQQLPTITIKPKGNTLELQTKSDALKTFLYTTLPYKTDKAEALNPEPISRPEFNIKEKRGYFSVRITQNTTATEFASVFTNKGERPARVLLYVVGTEAYTKAMKDYFQNTVSITTKSKTKFKAFSYLNNQHNEHTLNTFKDSVKMGDAIVFCHQQIADTPYTDKEKQRDGVTLLNTNAQHIVRLYEHYNTKYMKGRAGATVTDSHRLWFGMGTNIQDVFIDHTETTAVATAYFTAQFNDLKGVNDWQTIAKGLTDKDTKVKIWLDGIQSNNTKPAQK